MGGAMECGRKADWRRAAWLVLLALLMLRLLLMVLLPLTDTTEARYAEIARKMLETGDWITLQHDYGIPFWAKPPLSSWLSALSMAAFGSNAFAVRLPSLVLSLGVLVLIADLARSRRGGDAALAATLILAGSLLFFVSAGAVMTDPALLFAITLSLAAFWHALAGRVGAWPYLFFVGLGIGLLAKGPIVLVLVGLPLIIWVAVRHEWVACWQRLPWGTGGLIGLAIALPWYLAAEAKTPGFIHYFLLGEHLGRFVEQGWSGDRYGFAHAAPRGIIWLYVLGALMPWCLIAPLWWLRRGAPVERDGWPLYLLLWSVVTPAFFSVCGNVIFPYALPMLPGTALLLVEWWGGTPPLQRGVALPWLAAMTVVLFAGVLALQAWQPGLLPSHKALVARWLLQRPEPGAALVYWDRRRAFSAEFYSGGRARTTHDPQVLAELLAAAPGTGYLVIKKADAHPPPPDLLARFELASRLELAGDEWLLLREREAAPRRLTNSGDWLWMHSARR